MNSLCSRNCAHFDKRISEWETILKSTKDHCFKVEQAEDRVTLYAMNHGNHADRVYGNSATRVYGNSTTLIDNIFINNPENNIFSSNTVSDTTDHFSQMCILTSHCKPFFPNNKTNAPINVNPVWGGGGGGGGGECGQGVGI